MDKGEWKKLLRNWGQALEKFNWKEEELEKLKGFHEMQKKVWEGSRLGRAERELERMEREYEEAVRGLRIEMVEILREKAKIDDMVKRMTMEEANFLRLRFEKGYGFDYIGIKMHLSRATLFRMQDKIIEKMERWQNEMQ